MSGLAEFELLPEWSLEPLAGTLDDPEPAIRATGVRALRSIASAPVPVLLTSMLGDHASNAVFETVWALHDLGARGFIDPAARPGLESWLVQEHDPFLAYAAFWALAPLPGTDPVRATFRLSDWGQRVWGLVTHG